MTTLLEAANARRSKIAAPADRPSQRRSSADPESKAHVRASVRDLVIHTSQRDEAGKVGNTFSGHASVTETSYEMYDAWGPYAEVIGAGAFDEDLARSDLDVPFVLGHDQMRRIARTLNGSLRLSMDEVGLLVEADLDPADLDVQYILPKLRSGLIDEMSFAFRIEKGQWSPDYSEYRIEKVRIHRGDVAIVGYGANPFTDAGVRAVAPVARKRGADLITEADLGGYRSLLA